MNTLNKVKFILDLESTYNGYKISCKESIKDTEVKPSRILLYWVKIIENKPEAFMIFDKAVKFLSNSNNFRCVETSSFFTSGNYPTSASAIFEEKNKVDLTKFIQKID